MTQLSEIANTSWDARARVGSAGPRAFSPPAAGSGAAARGRRRSFRHRTKPTPRKICGLCKGFLSARAVRVAPLAHPPAARPMRVRVRRRKNNNIRGEDRRAVLRFRTATATTSLPPPEEFQPFVNRPKSITIFLYCRFG